MDRQVGYVDKIAESAPVQSSEWSRPSKAWVEARDGEEVISWEGPARPVRHGAAQERMLADFMALADAPGDKIARFVQKWGTLGICRHGLPHTHLPVRMWDDLDLLEARPCVTYVTFPRKPPFETVERWHHFASQATALHKAAQIIKKGDPVPPELWETMRDLYPQGWVLDESTLPPGVVPDLSKEPDAFEERRKQTEYRLMTFAVQRWLNMGDVGVHVRWENGKGSISYGGTGLVGAIALQLALTCTSTRSFYTCSGCESTYLPKRHPRSSEYHYCGQCRDDGTANRDRQRRFRARRKARRRSDSE